MQTLGLDKNTLSFIFHPRNFQYFVFQSLSHVLNSISPHLRQFVYLKEITDKWRGIYYSENLSNVSPLGRHKILLNIKSL